MSFDLAIVETGNGGDFVFAGRDLSVVRGLENMAYLGMFGGNVEAVTKNNVVEQLSKDYWANNLLWSGDQSIQFNATVEKTLNTVSLNSSGRVQIENSIKDSLSFMNDLGATLTVEVQIAGVDRVDILIKVMQANGKQKIIVLNFKKTTDGDFFLMDFNNDFLL